MRFFPFLCSLLVLPFFGIAGQTIVVSGGGKLTVFQLAGEALEKTRTIELSSSSGPMGISPNGKFLYVNTALITEAAGKKKQRQSAIATFSISEDGKLSHLHTAPSVWGSGYLRPDATGKFFAGSNYGKGKVAIQAIDEDGIFRGKLVREFELEKCAHSSVFSPDNRFLFVPATGPNKIFQMVFNPETGAIHPNQPSSAPASRGDDMKISRQPRHLIFHPEKDIAYTTNEREQAGAGVWKFDPEQGILESIQGIPSVDPETEGVTTADLHLSPDNRFLFVSNRDIKNRNEPEGRDAIAVFSVDPDTGKLSLVKRFPCERVPRSFAIGKEGKWLFVSGQGDSKLGLYAIDPESGHLTKKASYPLPGKPTWVSVF